jgi:hypothetical protein
VTSTSRFCVAELRYDDSMPENVQPSDIQNVSKNYNRGRSEFTIELPLAFGAQ